MNSPRFLTNQFKSFKSKIIGQPFNLTNGTKRFLQTTSSKLNKTPKKLEVEEFTLKVPWGHICGKWWGNKSVRPILAMHGWQDNAATFDTLIPLLPDHIGYLSIDLPGHGLSSHYPLGAQYSTLDYLCIFDLIRCEHNWNTVSLMAHSMSSQLSYTYASVFPERCDLLIGIDALKPIVRSTKRFIEQTTKQVDKLLIDINRNKNPTEPPSYTWDELLNITFKGTNQALTKQAAPYLLARGVLPSKNHPDKFYFSRDNRVKLFNFLNANHELNNQLATRINIPHLFIKAQNSSFYEDETYYYDTLKVLQQQNPKFELFNVDGTHYVHLTEPEKISTKISDFIRKYRPNV